MNSRTARLLSLALSVMMVIGCMTVPVFAEDSKEIILDDRSHFESDCNPSANIFTLKTDEEAAFFFCVTGEPGKIDYRITDITTKKDVKTFDYDNVYGLYKSAVLRQGSYEISVDCSSACKLTVDREYGYISIEANGNVEMYSLGGYHPSHILLEESDTAKISYITLGGEDMWIRFDGEYKNSVELKAGEKTFFSHRRGGGPITVKQNVDTEFTCDQIRFVLLNEGDDYSTSFPYTSSISNDQVRPALMFNYGDGIGRPYQYEDDQLNLYSVSSPIKIEVSLDIHDFQDIYFTNTKIAELNVYVKDTSGSNKLVPNTETAVHLENITDKNVQKVYVFTPEKDGICKLTSSGDGSDPTVAVFDETDDLVAWYRDSANPMDIFSQSMTNIKIDCQLDLNTELKGGHTYYFYLTNYAKNPDFTIKMTYDEKEDEPTPVITDPGKTDPDIIIPDGPSEPTFGDFVERLYVVALGRASEPEGKAFWTEHVGNGDLNGAQCANEFLLSKEFKDRGLNDEQFLEVLYKTFFDREAKDDKDGFDFWMNSLKTQGRDVVVDCFINSTEWCNVCATYGVKSGATRAKATIASKNATAFATRLYTECLGREPEEGGLKFWSLGLTNLELTGSAAAHEFFFCKEFNDHNFDNKELITRMYRTFMGREPDDEGMTFWLDSMGKGMTKQQVFDSFVKSPEFTQICKDYAIERG